MNNWKKTKYLNDPIYGFIEIKTKLIFDIVEHPFFQRLRRISQMGISSLVYPGARHSRFEHALGCMFLMQNAVVVLQKKGIQISEEESEALQIAILLHDIGHGPFSHAIEREIIVDENHEIISLQFMKQLNVHFEGKITLAIQIFTNQYSRRFFYQLISSQLDLDRLDYLKRDSFYTGVTEGNINSQRLISMLYVHNDQLVVEEKGIHSVEQFLFARRLMYWQVYLHKTSLVSEILLEKVLFYARILINRGHDIQTSPNLHFFLTQEKTNLNDKKIIEYFAQLDDYDIIYALKLWKNNANFVLKDLSQRILNRNLFTIEVRNTPFTEKEIEEKKNRLKHLNLNSEQLNYFVFQGEMSNQAYITKNDNVFIYTKSKQTTPLQNISNLFSTNNFSTVEIKYYLCYAKH